MLDSTTRSGGLRFQGGCLAAAGLLLFAADAIDVRGDGDKLATIARSPDRHLGWALLGMLATLLLIPGSAGLARTLEIHRRRLAGLGAALAMIGVIGLAAQRGLHVAYLEMASPQADRTQMAALFDRIDGNAGTAVIVLGAIAGTLLGQLVLTIGLWRIGRLPVWVPALLVLTVAAGGAASSPLPSDAIWALALAWAGLLIARAPVTPPPARSKVVTGGASLTARQATASAAPSADLRPSPRA